VVRKDDGSCDHDCARGPVAVCLRWLASCGVVAGSLLGRQHRSSVVFMRFLMACSFGGDVQSSIAIAMSCLATADVHGDWWRSSSPHVQVVLFVLLSCDMVRTRRLIVGDHDCSGDAEGRVPIAFATQRGRRGNNGFVMQLLPSSTFPCHPCVVHVLWFCAREGSYQMRHELSRSCWQSV
jgi:hypothetical protein